jgi:hypothetical protein
MRARGLLLTAALLVCTTVPALGAPIIDWDPAFYYEPGATFSNSNIGSELKIVGTVSLFGPPLDFLNANMPGTEYTFYISGLISQGTVTFGAPGTQFYITTYNGGTIQIYEDATPDAVFDPFPPNATVPSTFTDGTVILSGTMDDFYTQTNDFTPNKTGNSEGHITWTGGTLIGHVGGANPCPALFTGGLTWNPNPNILIPGYLFRHDGKVDHECPVPTQPGTWGRIKKLYR